ncbi:polyketide synthase dehydratase domain-containing protein [Candidatus Obscuribacterales bacterium]|nr:polyketide synthase dehydratase domain-containing protein [Candidatus Obscuribacterales bacterium]
MSSAANRNSGKIAIVGMSCLYPGAPDLSSFWSNIVRGVDATREVSSSEWDVDDYYDPESRKFGSVYSKRGGFISEYADFDPLQFGVMPSGVAGGDPDQFLTLRVAHEAMADAGYLDGKKQFDKDRAEVILGRISAPGAGSMNLTHQSKTVHEVSGLLRGLLPNHPEVVDAAVSEMTSRLVTCNSDTIPSAMPNVLAGRIAAKLGFRGRNLLIDAACASSMVAVETAVQDLLSHQCDFALAGGLHVNASPVFFQMFCGLGALSRKDIIRPFDESADGTLLGEGIGILVLKRHEDAIADGDRIYATICGVASSSDGYGGSVLSPSLDGEALAMEKAYKMAGISPKSIGLLEAHGTGTPTGDVVELQAVEKVFGQASESRDGKPWCAIGSVKSMIGHCQSASAVAGIIKAALALHHKILPPTLHVSEPNRKINWEKHPCYVNTQSRPWIHAENSEEARRAAVSAFGFGGINGHMILEEAEKGSSMTRHKSAVKAASEQGMPVTPAASLASLDSALMRTWDSEVFALSANSPAELAKDLETLETYVTRSMESGIPEGFFKDLAFSINCRKLGANGATGGAINMPANNSRKIYRLSIVAANLDELVSRVQYARKLIEAGKPAVQEADKGVYYTSPGTAIGGKVGFLYPGLGSAYGGMLSDLCMHFPEVREVFDIVDTVALAEKASVLPSRMIFPPDRDSSNSMELASADFAVVAILLAEYALHQLLLHLEIKPDALMGCSTGEFAAITTGGAVDVLSVSETFYGLSTNVARAIPAAALAELRSLRILAPASDVMALVKNNDVHLSADLGERHIIVTGTIAGTDALSDELAKRKIVSQVLPIAIPYHTPLVHDLIDGEHDAVKSVDIRPLVVPSYACSTAERYPADEKQLRAMFTDLFTKPIRLRETIQTMYDDGIRLFIEVGPGGVLSSVVDGILGSKPHIAVPTNLSSKPALTQLNHVLAALYTQGVSANFEYLYMRRAPVELDWRSLKAPVVKRQPLKLSLVHTKLEVSPELAVPLAQTVSQISSLPDNSPHDRYENTQSDCGSSEVESANLLGSFMNTNAAFYSRMAATQERIMTAFLSSNVEQPFSDETNIYASDDVQNLPGLVSHHQWQEDRQASECAGLQQNRDDFGNVSEPPFLSRFRIRAVAGSTEFDLHIGLDTDLYLLDHAVGGQVSVEPPARVFLMPLMVSLEIMAEAASAHAGEGVIVRLEQVKAFKRISVDHLGVDLHLSATGDSSRVHVKMFDAGDMVNPILIADFLFAMKYPEVASAPEITVTGNSPTNLTERSQLYAPPNMFHGSRMQAVTAITNVGNKSIEGLAEASPARHWMPHVPVANFLLHPLLLDNASQFVLFYLYEKQMPAIALLPFFIESVEFFYSPNDLPPVISGRALLHTVSEKATEAKVEVVDDLNRVWMRVNGINSKRVMPHEKLVDFFHKPLQRHIATRRTVNQALSHLCVLTEFKTGLLPADDAILDWCLDYLLTRSERSFWRTQLKFEKRKTDWLHGRIAAKEAVRMLVKERLGREIGMLDIEISNDFDRRPLVAVSGGIAGLSISISHTDGIAVALASFLSDGKPGVDAEKIQTRDPDLADRFLTVDESGYLNSCASHSRDTELTRLWSAKEAVYKSLGGEFELTSFEIDVSSMTPYAMSIHNTGTTSRFQVYSELVGDYVLSYTLA